MSGMDAKPLSSVGHRELLSSFPKSGSVLAFASRLIG